MNIFKIICLAWGILVMAAIFAGKRQYFLDGTRMSQRFGQKFAIVLLVALTVALATVQTVFASGDYLEEGIGALLMAFLIGGGALVAFDAVSKNCRTALQQVLDDHASQRLAENLKRQELLEEQPAGQAKPAAPTREQQLKNAELLLVEERNCQQAAKMAAMRKLPPYRPAQIKPEDKVPVRTDVQVSLATLVFLASFQPRVEAYEMPQVTWLSRQAKTGL